MNLKIIISIFALFLISISNQNCAQKIENAKSLKYVALGDSYTIGESVCETCNFPTQLQQQLESSIKQEIELNIIAQTGWTTTNLISAIDKKNVKPEFDLVTLLIGVNNQYQHKDFSIYETEFPALVNKAIALGKGEKKNVIVVSIPDYGFTPFGKRKTTEISREIDRYNAFAEVYCKQHQIQFVNITDITKQGLENPKLVAADGLHPSKLAYSKFVAEILPKALEILQN